MKKVLLILLFAALLPFAAADAQNIALGERVPELKVPAWLDGQKPAATPRLTYVEFFQSSNAACITSLKQLRAMTDKLGTKLRVVVITQEKEDKIGPLLRPYLSPQISVARFSRRSACSTFRSGCWSIPKTGRSGREIHFN